LASKAEEQLRRLSVELQLLEQTAENMQSRLNLLNAAITDLTYAGLTMDGLEKEKDNVELLVPIGGSSYIKAKLDSIDKLIVGIGAGVSVEKTLPETKEVIKNRREELEKTRLSLQTQFSQVVDKINDDRRQADSLIAQMREGKTPANV
jgi:prefoldin alpha subunit